MSTDYLLNDKETSLTVTTEVEIKNKSLEQRIRLIDSLDEADQQALIRVIDSMLTKERVRELLNSNINQNFAA